MRPALLLLLLTILPLALPAEQAEGPSRIPVMVGYGRLFLYPSDASDLTFASTSEGVAVRGSDWDTVKHLWTVRLECGKAAAGALRVLRQGKEVAKIDFAPFDVDYPGEGGVINASTGQQGAQLVFKPNVPGITVHFLSHMATLVFPNGKQEWTFPTDAAHADGAYQYLMTHTDRDNRVDYAISLLDGECEIDSWEVAPSAIAAGDGK